MTRLKNFGVLSAAMLLGWAGATCAVTDEEFQALQARIAELEKRENDNWMTQERADQIKALVNDVLADARNRGQFLDSGVTAGYNNGFFLKTADDKFKLVVGGVLQVRYEYVRHHQDRNQYGANATLTQGNTENASGFDLRRARINFAGNVFSPDIFYRLEGDFYGSATGGFTVTDAYLGYRFTGLFKLRAGAFKTPFTKSQQEYDANLELERPEVDLPFDAQRSLGFSLFGDLIPDTLSYELNANDGAKSNIYRYVDTYSNVATVAGSATPTYNVGNRPACYSRVQYAGAGKISDFYVSEADLRPADHDGFIWLLGGAVGYESQNSGAAAFAQNSVTVPGLGSNDSPGFARAYVLNGDLYRATLDWSAKWQGWSFDTAAYFQQVNATPDAGTVSTGLPYRRNKASFFEQAYYAQVGYMIIPSKLELLSRFSILLDEGDPNSAQYYTLGAAYYLFGNNAKIQADINYTPKAAFTDASTLQIANTQEVYVRLQLQLKF